MQTIAAYRHFHLGRHLLSYKEKCLHILKKKMNSMERSPILLGHFAVSFALQNLIGKFVFKRYSTIQILQNVKPLCLINLSQPKFISLRLILSKL